MSRFPERPRFGQDPAQIVIPGRQALQPPRGEIDIQAPGSGGPPTPGCPVQPLQREFGQVTLEWSNGEVFYQPSGGCQLPISLIALLERSPDLINLWLVSPAGVTTTPAANPCQAICPECQVLNAQFGCGFPILPIGHPLMGRWIIRISAVVVPTPPQLFASVVLFWSHPSFTTTFTFPKGDDFLFEGVLDQEGGPWVVVDPGSLKLTPL